MSRLCKPHIVLLFVLSLGEVALFASDIPTPWTAPRFTIDPKVLYEQASESAAPEGTNVSVLDDEEGYSFDASGRGLYTEYTVYKVLTQQGAEGWSSISVTWEPWHQERPGVRIRVITPDYVVHDLDLKTLTDAPAQDEQSNIYSDRRVIRGPLPAVAPGSVIEQEIVVRENTPYFSAGTVGRYFFGRVSVPVRHSGPMVDLNALVSSGSGLYLDQPVDINGRGEIVAMGVLPSGDNHAVLLIPCDHNHPGIEGCDYSMVEGSPAALVQPTSRATPAYTLPTAQWRRSNRFHFPALGPKN